MWKSSKIKPKSYLFKIHFEYPLPNYHNILYPIVEVVLNWEVSGSVLYRPHMNREHVKVVKKHTKNNFISKFCEFLVLYFHFEVFIPAVRQHTVIAPNKNRNHLKVLYSSEVKTFQIPLKKAPGNGGDGKSTSSAGPS